MWPIVKQNDYKHLAEFTGFANNYVMQLMHFEDGAAFNPRNVVNNLYGKFNPQMMADYRREWVQHELPKGKQTDRDQVVWLLAWLKDRLKVAKAYYNADPNCQLIPLGMPTGIATEFKGQSQAPKTGNLLRGRVASASALSKKPSVSIADNLYTLYEPEVNVFAAAVPRGRGRGTSRALRGGMRGRGCATLSGAAAPSPGRGSGGGALHRKHLASCP